jgi:hypothetical protein
MTGRIISFMEHSIDNDPAGAVTISPIIPGRWTHFREEDVDDVQVYRRFAESPPSTPRDGFEVLRDGTFIRDEIDLAGAIFRVRGRWRQPTVDQLTVSFDDGVHTAFTLRAVELSADLDLLRVRHLPESEQAPPTSS